MVKEHPLFSPKRIHSSITNNSDASENIWINFNDFIHKAQDTENYSKKIIKSAIEANKNLLIEEKSEISKRYTSCHISYRH